MKSFITVPLDFSKIDTSALLHSVDPRNALGMFTATPDSDYADTLEQATKKFPFPIIGGTVLANPFETSDIPFMESLDVLAREDLRHAIALSEPIDGDRVEEQMRKLHEECLDGLDDEPKLFLLLAPIFPDLYIDPFLDALLKLVGDVPVFGGIMSDDFRSGRSAVFFDGKAYRDRIVLVALGGDINPVFGMGRRVTVLSEYAPIVTEAKENVIIRVDDMPFTGYMKKLGFGPEAIADFPITVRVRAPEEARGGLPNTRALVAMDEESGTGTLDSAIETGSSIALGFLTRRDILESASECIDQLLEAMRREEENGRRFSTVLAVSGLARYYTMFGQGNIEAAQLKNRLPPGMHRLGFFSFGQFCPFRNADGGLSNGKHGQTLGLCAI